jgi:hypothetical protein
MKMKPKRCLAESFGDVFERALRSLPTTSGAW